MHILMMSPTRYRRLFLSVVCLALSAALFNLYTSDSAPRGTSGITSVDSHARKGHRQGQLTSPLDKRIARERARSRAFEKRVWNVLTESKQNITSKATLTFINDSIEKKSVVNASVKMADHSHHSFDAEKVYKLFCSCRGDNDIISVDCYSDAYEELCKLFRLFGTVFSFVTSDVEEKIGILRDYAKGEHAEQYKTVQSMLEFEVSNNLTKNKKKASGARTLLRLHRALEFISALLTELKQADNHVKFSSNAMKAYDSTLARHHPWLIRKGVHVALYMIPNRSDLLKKMGVEDNEKGMSSIGELINELNVIFQITEKLYEKDNLLDLP